MLKQLRLWEEQSYFAPYWLWEDWKAGMYRTTDPADMEQSVNLAAMNLSSEDLCRSSMDQVILDWPVSSGLNLHDVSINRRPWLGRACCCIGLGVREDATRIAWWKITEVQRDIANAIADEIIFKWERSHA